VTLVKVLLNQKIGHIDAISVHNIYVQASESSCRYEQVLGITWHHIPTRSQQLSTKNQQAQFCKGLWLPTVTVAFKW